MVAASTQEIGRRREGQPATQGGGGGGGWRAGDGVGRRRPARRRWSRAATEARVWGSARGREPLEVIILDALRFLFFLIWKLTFIQPDSTARSF
jgi:hypothetical protein